MQKWVSSRGRIALIAGFLAGFLLVLTISTYTLYKRAGTHLDNELGERLQSIAMTLSHAIAIDVPDRGIEPGAFGPSLYTLLYSVKMENLLSNIVLLTVDGITVVDISNVTEPGEPNPFVDLDIGAVTLARSGLPASTNLYQSENIYLKSAYAPVIGNDGDVIGILGVEAGASYFDVLRAMGTSLIVINVAGIIIVALLAFFFYRQTVSLDKAQAAIIQGENLATMGRMVAGIAHEIRNPLSIIKTSAERLERKYNKNDEVFSYISEEVDSLNRILTGYLNFAKAEKQIHEPHPLPPIVGRCLRILEVEIAEKSVDVTTSIPDAELVVRGDDKRIQQAILNILLNALQAVDSNGEVSVTLVRRARAADVIVRDNGGGIPAKDLKEITKPFFTTKKHGSGLGMNIVSNIVEEHHGTLNIESEPGKGTEVTISFPLASGA
ncbi:MAG: ATP-binding protein [bacterium]|nr:ATP-binding protein [bacterium]